jgi:hypothetical protein
MYVNHGHRLTPEEERASRRASQRLFRLRNHARKLVQLTEACLLAGSPPYRRQQVYEQARKLCEYLGRYLVPLDGSESLVDGRRQVECHRHDTRGRWEG